MNKYFFTIMLAIILTANYAHTQTFGVRTGLNYSYVLSKKYNTNETTAMKFGFQLGTVANYSLSDKFSIDPGLLFSTLGIKTQWTYMDLDHEEVESMYYIQVPIHVQYKFGNIFLLHAGPYFGFAVGENRIYKTFKDGKKIDSWNYKTFFDYYCDYSDGVLRTGFTPINRIFDCGLGVGAAVKFSNIRVGLESSIGIIRKNDTFAHDEIFSYHRNIWLSLTATYMFGK